jgi:hypothetical protein
MTTREPALEDELEIRRLVENWAVWRDTGRFDAFLDLWSPDGWMMATWFQASAADFTARARAAFDQGSRSMHVLGGTGVELGADRAVAQTRMRGDLLRALLRFPAAARGVLETGPAPAGL